MERDLEEAHSSRLDYSFLFTRLIIRIWSQDIYLDDPNECIN